MKVYCKYSGISYEIPATFGSYEHVSVHPVFDLPIKFLFSRAGDWAANRLNVQERKLLFLAILNTTELIVFRQPAFPSDAIVQSHMESAMRIVSWITALRNPAVLLPQFVVAQESQSLSNVGHWLDTWYAARKDFEDGYVEQGKLAKLRNREYALERLIKNAQRKVDDYAGLLSAWAFDAGSVPLALREFWKPLFTTKGVAIYSLNSADIDECLEHMEDHLEHGSIYSNAVLKHLRLTQQKNKQGLAFGLGMMSDEFQGLDLEKLSKQPFKIISDDIEIANKEVIAARAPSERPAERNYVSRVAYLRAKIAWEMAEKARAYAEEFTSSIEQKLEVDEQINNEAEFDDEASGSLADLEEADAAQDAEAAANELGDEDGR